MIEMAGKAPRARRCSTFQRAVEQTGQPVKIETEILWGR
ncbi:hypothetical protein I551_0345, partial [Mycobacterium ulcerans str. Harvey]